MATPRGKRRQRRSECVIQLNDADPYALKKFVSDAFVRYPDLSDRGTVPLTRRRVWYSSGQLLCQFLDQKTDPPIFQQLKEEYEDQKLTSSGTGGLGTTATEAATEEEQEKQEEQPPAAPPPTGTATEPATEEAPEEPLRGRRAAPGEPAAAVAEPFLSTEELAQLGEVFEEGVPVSGEDIVSVQDLLSRQTRGAGSLSAAGRSGSRSRSSSRGSSKRGTDGGLVSSSFQQDQATLRCFDGASSSADIDRATACFDSLVAANMLDGCSADSVLFVLLTVLKRDTAKYLLRRGSSTWAQRQDRRRETATEDLPTAKDWKKQNVCSNDKTTDLVIRTAVYESLDNLYDLVSGSSTLPSSSYAAAAAECGSLSENLTLCDNMDWQSIAEASDTDESTVIKAKRSGKNKTDALYFLESLLASLEVETTVYAINNNVSVAGPMWFVDNKQLRAWSDSTAGKGDVTFDFATRFASASKIYDAPFLVIGLQRRVQSDDRRAGSTRVLNMRGETLDTSSRLLPSPTVRLLAGRVLHLVAVLLYNADKRRYSAVVRQCPLSSQGGDRWVKYERVTSSGRGATTASGVSSSVVAFADDMEQFYSAQGGVVTTHAVCLFYEAAL